MKILNIVKTSNGAKWAFEQAKELMKLGIEVVTLLPKNEGTVASMYIDSNMQVVTGDFSTSFKNVLHLKRKRKEFNEIILQIEPDIIHCHFVTNILLLRLCFKNSNIPRIFQVPGPLHLESILYRNLEIFVAGKKDYWIATCKYSYEKYKKYKKTKNKLFLSYYGGYGGEECTLYKKKSNILHNQYNLPENAFLVGMVSYFYKPKALMFQRRGIKGHEDFIEGFSMLLENNHNFYGIVIGGPWVGSEKYYNRIREYSNKLCGNRVVFTGFRNDLKSIYTELDLVIHPSLSENLGGAAESLAASVPTITTNVGGFTDIIIPGVTGYLVPPKNPLLLRDSIIIATENYSRSLEMAHNGKAKVMTLLDIKSTVQQLVIIYNDVLKERKL